MMYSQQEYEMVRRQTMQIEAEKRAFLRIALIVVSILLAAALFLSGLMYRRYSTAGSRIQNAENRAAGFEQQLQEVTKELEEKKALLAQNAATEAKQNQVIQEVVPKMLSKTARDVELAAMAHAIYQQPGHMISLPGIPPDNVLRRFRHRVDDVPHSYVLVAGQVDGQWRMYSNLVKNKAD